MNQQWDDLDFLINSMRTPNQSIDELINSLESIDFAGMLEHPCSKRRTQHDDQELYEDGHCYLHQAANVSDVDNDECGLTITVAFTMEDIQNAWGDNILADNLLNIPKRERLRAKTIFLNLLRVLRVLVPAFDASCKRISQSHAMKPVHCANRILELLSDALYCEGKL
ncbi:hypothetical protein H310_14597 [Aphanomyces invadans]|uniref:Uncharacterized protein n=1 Tax=Aphanomyces invadans TaxID=157072 RepID=A0A024TB98_9STRA|nr:hypothetical protein H310_14597 [Aphanomyces invadans]ETV90632.1 hypothetical protein H310_14597 [Aphanomyces invadans]|eukprot:XP_008880702.1 hypothetical protein H310_14597 [Aphanomyces invadans]